MNRKRAHQLIYLALAIQAGSLLACGISAPAANIEEPPPSSAPHSPPAVTKQPVDIACTHYVALDGDDDNPGTQENPWTTLQHAADVAQPGDVVCLREGVYHQYTELTRSGAPRQPITYAATPGETVWLDGQGTGWKYGLDLGDPGVSYITIAGLNMRHWQDGSGDGGCIISWSDSDYVTIRDAELHHCGHGGISFYENSDYITVENVTIHDNTLVGMDCGNGPCRHWVLRRVRAIDNGLGDSDTAADGIAIEDGDDILVEDCEASGNSGDGFDFKSSGTTLRRVVAIGNGRDNIKLWGQRSSLINGLSADAGLVGLVLSGGGSYTVTHSLIASRRSYGYLAESGADNDDATPVALYNTIFYNDDPEMGGTIVAFSAGVRLRADHNLYYNPYREEDVICAYFLGSEDDACFTHAQINDGTWFARTGQGAHSAYGDPLFAGASAKNFHLSADSPAIDMGTSAWSCPGDLEGHTRPVGSAPDLGPYEYPADRQLSPSSSLRRGNPFQGVTID
jgi:hypothetical protein